MQQFRDLDARDEPAQSGRIARTLGLGSHRIRVPEIPRGRLARTLQGCWEHAPLLFGVPRGDTVVKDDPRDLAKPGVEYLEQWRALGTVFHHGAWVAFSLGRPGGELLGPLMASFRSDGWDCRVSPEPM
jgi:hypothetical protein